MRDESVVDDTNVGSESSGDRAEGQGDGMATIESVQINGPSVREASPENDERGRLTKESQATVVSRLRPRTHLVKQSKVTLGNTRSVRPRPKAESTRPERLPAVSEVIPSRRTDELVASTETNPPTRARRCSHWGGGDSGNLNNGRRRRASTREYSPLLGGPSPKASGRPRKRPKRALENTSALTNDIVGKCTGQSQTPLEGGLAVTLGKTLEIFGRGALRIQAHGPRHVYFMSFLPEVPHRPSMPSPSEMPPGQSPRPEDFSENASSRTVVCRRRNRTMSTTCEDGDGWSTRHSTKPPRNSRCRDDRNENQRKPRRRLPWSSEEVDFLQELRGDKQRP